MSDPVVARFLLREAGPVFPSHTALPTAVPSGISTIEGPDECAWEQQLDPWPCCVLWQSAPCAMRVSAGDSVQRSGCHNPVHRVPRTTPKGAGLAGSAKLPFWGCARGEARQSLELKVPRAPSGHSLQQERNTFFPGNLLLAEPIDIRSGEQVSQGLWCVAFVSLQGGGPGWESGEMCKP